MRAFADTIGEAVVDEDRLIDRLELRNEPVVHDAITKGRRMDFARLGCRRYEAGWFARRPAARGDLPLQLNQAIDPVRIEGELVQAWPLCTASFRPGRVK